MSTPRTDWHRLFGLLLSDYFTGTPFTVELEKDLSIKRQLLDVVVVRREPGAVGRKLPDGLDGLAAHNLITFKSHHEPLDDWSLKELTGHYVNYRKQVSASPHHLLPESDFRLYAVCSRHPDRLETEVRLTVAGAGVYDCRRGSDSVRVIVLRELPKEKHNSLWHVISGNADLMKFGIPNLEQRTKKTSNLLYEVLSGFASEGIPMPYTMADFERDFVQKHAKEFLEKMTPEQIAESLEGDKLEAVLKLVENRTSEPKPRKKRRK